MFNSQTVFIVGAGASAEAGLPVGAQLTQEIADRVNLRIDGFTLTSGDAQIHHTLTQLANTGEWQPNNFLGSGQAIAEAMELAPSIDTFLETHRENKEFVLLGKLGIANSIRAAERRSKMAPSDEYTREFSLRSLADTWYPSLAQQMFTGVSANRPELAFANVSFVVFNYDRCLQRYLTRAVAAYFRMTASQAAEVVASVTFVHPYGSIGDMFRSDGKIVEFAPANFALSDAVNQIKTYSESSETSATIKQLIYSAETLVFLGFAFHDANMDLLDPETTEVYERGFGKRVFATTLGLSASDESVVRGQLSTMLTGESETNSFGEWIFTNRGTCKELFNSYWRSMTA